ncbi:MAG: DUF3144 domain-containing protein [Brachymonas sp.]|nr:DUF3144 domain-containing protein [Brachymonas sp.]
MACSAPNDTVDAGFYDRADAHIELSNTQITPSAGIGKVSASMLYAAARFNAFVSASGFASSQEMAAARQETLDYFCHQYRAMLAEHLDDYISRFDDYMVPGSQPAHEP